MTPGDAEEPSAPGGGEARVPRDARPWRAAVAVPAVLLLAWAGVAALYVAFGRVNTDEGMHLQAGRLLLDGMLPYRDFPFGQGPAAPVFYGLVQWLSAPTLLAGRLASAVFNAVGIGALVLLCHRVAGPLASVVAVALVAFNPAILWTLDTVRTEPVAMPFVALACLAFFRGRGSTASWALPASLLVWATAARLTSALLLAAALSTTAFALRSEPRRLLRVAGIVLANGIAAFLPMLLALRESLFHVLVAQATRVERLAEAPPTWEAALRGRAMFLTEPGASHGPILATTLVALVWVARCHPRPWRLVSRARRGEPWSVVALLIAMAALLFAPQLFLLPTFAVYLVMASVLLATACGIALAQAIRAGGRLRATAWMLCVVLVAWLPHSAWGTHAVYLSLGRSPFPGQWALRRELRAILPRPCTVLAVRTQMATTSGCRILPGLEYSGFGLFPTLETPEARRRDVLNRERLTQLLARTPPELSVLTRDDLGVLEGRAIGPDEPLLPRVLRGRYRRLRSYEEPTGPSFGQPTVRFEVFVRSDLLDEGRGPAPKPR